MGICFWGCAFWCFLIVRYVKGSTEASKLEYLENIRGDSEQMGPQELRVTSHHIQTFQVFLIRIVLQSSTDTMTSKSIDGKDRCALNCCLHESTNQSPSVDFQSHQNSWIFHRSHPPLRPPSTSRASVRSKGKAALAMVALGVQPLSLLLTNVGPFGDDSPNLPMIPGFGHDVRSLM